MDVRRLKTKVTAGFKMRGLMLRPETSKYLVEVLEAVNEVELEDVIERILDEVEKQPLSSSMVELSVAEAAVQDCSQSCDETIDNVFNIIGAFDVPKFIYSTERKKFVPVSMTSHTVPSVCGQAREKSELFRERYSILHQLKTVEALLGSTTKLGEVIVLGMITQLKEFHSGLYTESGFVLAEGWYEDSVFHVSAFGFPPIESSFTTRAYYGNANFFGGPSTIAVKASAKLKQLEEENVDAMFVIISDLWLDSVEVLEKIQTMFSGYSTMPPTCFIFCGNFSSAPYGKSQIKSLKESLKVLADLICEHPSIHHRPPLGEHITEEFRQRVPFSVFTTNPCRIQYCSQEIVVIREDLVSKMCRNCLRPPSPNLDIPNHFVKTILSQGHLTPLPLYVSPVYWAYDYALRVYPVPDVVIFADKYDPFCISNSDFQDNEELVASEVLVVDKVTHHTIELSWSAMQEDRSGLSEKWTSYVLEQMNPKTHTYGIIYMGYSTQYIVKKLEPCTLYKFRLRINRPNQECHLTSTVSACTSSEPLNGKHLHQAVNRNDEDELNRVLQSEKVNVNVCDKLGFTPIMVAAQKGFIRMIKILVEHGADIHMKNGSGKDPLMLACFAGHLDIVKHLRKSGATWQSQDTGGCSPLHWAADGGHLPIITYMIKDGCELDIRDTVSQWTPLMRVSAVSGNANVASLLIQAGADVNVRDKDGKTPLMVAVLNNHEQLVRLLMDSGADWDVKNEFGSSAIEMAKAFGKQVIPLN
ncbi:DNA polymerase epsilon subunit 2 [Bagarius yarrelli]|uniref:DNA polymerase epsilon subunit 2 n=1 Tax=Bagarius yarrelli TaxID=175774 RepID=A0A556V5Z1_BAGYA|nr:DNA polymerase epsilon subunit 2 [Bagarius yarrelli]